jgi:hypothetical protein
VTSEELVYAAHDIDIQLQTITKYRISRLATAA